MVFFSSLMQRYAKKMNSLKANLSLASYRKDLFIGNLVPIIFFIFCVASLPLSGFSLDYIGRELMSRISRNSFLVLALLLPILAGMGLNFGMVLGAMCGQIGIIFITNWQIVGIPGVVLAILIAIPLGILAGIFCGVVLNRARGYEMVTGYILGYFVNGIYQLIVLYFMGSIIPITNEKILLSQGFGIRSSIDLIDIRQSIENFWSITVYGINVPLFTLLLITLLAVGIRFFYRTKLGQDMRAIGQDAKTASSMGINVNKIRIKSIVISTVLASVGMVLYLQNIGTLNTYNSHEQIGLFSIAALLVGGGSVNKAKIRHVFLGLILFHTMFIITPSAGKNLFNNAALGEYFRVFISYGVIAFALILYAVETIRKKNQADFNFSQSNEETV